MKERIRRIFKQVSLAYIAIMYATFTIVKYPKWLSIAGILSMAIFRISFSQNKKISFYKLMGSGRGGSFSTIPDLSQWAIFCVYSELPKAIINEKNLNLMHCFLFGKFVARWFSFFQCNTNTFILQPISGHGKWDGNEIFSDMQPSIITSQKIAVLTRATIRLRKLARFWQHVEAVNRSMLAAPGYIFSIGVGEVPWIRQATFSIWQNENSMRNFAYKTPHHKQVIENTRKEKWYSEEMFIRFSIINTMGDLKDGT